MKTFKLFAGIIAIAVLLNAGPALAGSKIKISQAQMDSLATSLAERLENGAWEFVPDRFTGTNNIILEFYDTPNNAITCMDNAILVSLNFIGTRVNAGAAAPHQRGRAAVGAAAVVNHRGMLPDYVKTHGEVVDKKVTIGKKSKSVTLEIRYNIEESNIDMPSSTTRIKLYVNTLDLSTRVTLFNMNLDGDMDGNLTLIARPRPADPLAE